MKTKKDYELLHLNKFKEVFDGFPNGKIIESERPDYIIDDGNRRICIEITRIYKSNNSNDPPMQAIESTCQKIAEAASLKCDTRRIPPLTVSLHFIHRTSVLKVPRDALINKIADFVCNHIPEPDSYHSFDYVNNDPTFPEHIHAITIGRYNVLTKHHFNVPAVGRVQKEFSTELQNAIDLKNKKLTEYNRTCLEHWLLIISEGSSPSTFFESSGRTKNNTFKSDFNRTFYMESFSGVSWELTTS